ncbi:hypothetical protein ABPG72_017137 [Tetrahymena utriculariae]
MIQQQCWICHQECVFQDNVLNQKNLSPCYCKGSLESVHRECLNQWVTKRYKKIINEIDVKEIQKMEESDFQNQSHPVMQKLAIQCPNCKYFFKYEVIELPQLPSIKAVLEHNCKEKIILLIMVVFQIGLLVLDYQKNDQREQGQQCSNETDYDKKMCSLQQSPDMQNQQGYDFVNILYIFTVFTVLIAAGYNIFSDSKINFGIHVKDKDYVENISKIHANISFNDSSLQINQG